MVSPSEAFIVRPLNRPTDLTWAETLLASRLGGRLQARRGALLDVLDLPGLIAELGGERGGLLTYRVDAEGCEIAALVASVPGRGAGSALVAGLRETIDADPIWVVTTNDNLRALRFYQRRGFALRSVRPGAVDDARRALKPEIPRTGDDGIPIRDEVELELRSDGVGEGI